MNVNVKLFDRVRVSCATDWQLALRTKDSCSEDTSVSLQLLSWSVLVKVNPYGNSTFIFKGTVTIGRLNLQPSYPSNSSSL